MTDPHDANTPSVVESPVARWFGRDPAVLTAQVTSALIALVMLLPFASALSAALSAVITAVGGGIVAFVVIRDGQLAALLGVAKAIVMLAIVLGAHIPDSYQVLILVAVEQLAGLFLRTQVTAPVDENGVKRPLPLAA